LIRHPETHLVETVCSTCGTEHTLRSTAVSLAVDVCSSCHPAYTGVQHGVARGDRIERFNRRLASATAARA
jgi:large subunit ribosomal protein L31